MTTTYASVERALVKGIYFSGRAEDLKPEDLEGKPGVIQGALGLLEAEMANLFDAADIEKPDARGGRYNAVIYDLETSKGDKAQLGVTTFRDGYNLWLIEPESGMCVRT